MADYKIRVKVGQNEFDAEGPKEFVEDLFRRFESLISGNTPMLPVVRPQTEDEKWAAIDDKATSPFAKVFHRDEKGISLIGRFGGEDRELDAALLILFGHKELTGANEVSADDLLYGLNQTGYTLERADRLMKHGFRKGLVVPHGVRRGTRYRLTVPGNARAKELAKELQDMFQIVP